MKLAKTRRHQANMPSADTLPDELKTFTSWLDPNGLHDYMAARGQWLDRAARLTTIMKAAGVSADEWFRRMLTR